VLYMNLVWCDVDIILPRLEMCLSGRIATFPNRVGGGIPSVCFISVTRTLVKISFHYYLFFFKR
jgi:hypothetical protein